MIRVFSGEVSHFIYTVLTRRVMVSDISSLISGRECTKFFDALQAADLAWEWDSRFKTALAQINIKEKNAIEAILENYLGTAWDSDTINTAPEKVQRILARLGGLMSGQLFYAVGLAERGIVFCAWWPWGNGQTISIRLGTDLEDSALLDALAKPDVR